MASGFRAGGVVAKIYDRTLERHARTVLAEIRSAAAELAALRGAQLCTINFGVSEIYIARIAPHAIRTFMTKRPGFGVNAVIGGTRELHRRLLVGKLDLVISPPPRDLQIAPQMALEALYC